MWGRGLHHLVYEVVDNSIDEAMGGYCDTIVVDINEDGSITVEDNGRIPWVSIKKRRFLVGVVMTKIGAGGKVIRIPYKVSGGLHGVGVSVVNALSNHRATVHSSDGKVYEQEYEKGKLYIRKTNWETTKEVLSLLLS
jgi:DNA gyrase subunit B